MKNQFTIQENKNLTEIYRRLNYFHFGNVDQKLMIISYPSEVKTLCDMGMIKPTSNELPRIMGWYSLTEKGKVFFKENYIHPISHDLNHSMFCGDYVKTFDKIKYNNIK